MDIPTRSILNLNKRSSTFALPCLCLASPFPPLFTEIPPQDNIATSIDASHTEPASWHQPIDYPAFEPPLSTDLMTSVALTGTNHAEDQPVHLRVVKTRKYVEELDRARARDEKANVAIGAGSKAVQTCAKNTGGGEEVVVVGEEKKMRSEHVRVNVGQYAGLLGRACPAGVYEYVDQEGSEVESGEGWMGKKLVINSQVRFFSLLEPSFSGTLMIGGRIVYIVNFAM